MQLLLENLFDIQGNIQNAKTYYRNQKCWDF